MSRNAKNNNKRYLLRRQRFAEHIEHEIRRLNSLEEWRDYRFAELEAEVEAEGESRVGLLKRTRSGLRREKSLSTALQNSTERLILVEGEPGSGKSVALRHVALTMAKEAINSKDPNKLIPIYINLKELVREHVELNRNPTMLEMKQLLPILTIYFNESELRTLCFDISINYEVLDPGNLEDKARSLIMYTQRHGLSKHLLATCMEKRQNLDWSWVKTNLKENQIDRNLIHGFVLKSLNRANDRDIEEFLSEAFEKGLKDGSWFFLFDSFDELPDVLSSTDVNEIIRAYSDAISDFLHGLNHCRGIVASRHFRGPRQTGWARFRILPLSEERRRELIEKADLESAIEQDLQGKLGNANQEIQSMSKNPLFLGLVCEHMRDGYSFPTNTHDVFETYITNRFKRDEDRLYRRFQLTPTEVRYAAENFAFAMAADDSLGLSPTRDKLEKAFEELNITVDENFETALDALEYIKLARSETATTSGDSKSFTFSHRRFQEYFATCVVLREPDRVSANQLLTDARWRETAVTLCQTQPIEALAPLLNDADTLLQQKVETIPNLIETPIKFIEELDKSEESEEPIEYPEPMPFTWPAGITYLLELVQSGFSSRLSDLPDPIKLKASQILLTASYYGTRYDRKWSLEVAGITLTPVLLWLLRDGFANSSLWLNNIAYQQAAYLTHIPDDIAKSIRHALLLQFARGSIRKERLTVAAHLNRLDKSEQFISSLNLLAKTQPLDLIFHLIIMLFFFFTAGANILSQLITSNFNGNPTLVWIIVIGIILGAESIFIASHLALRSTSIVVAKFSVEKKQVEIYLGGLLRIIFTMFIILFSGWPAKIVYFLSLWAILAFSAVKVGKFTTALKCPLVSVVPLIALLQYPKKSHLVSKVIKGFFKNLFWWALLGTAIAFLLSDIYFGISLTAFLETISKHPYGLMLNGIFAALFLFAMALFSIYILVGYFLFLRSWINDKWMLSSQKKVEHNTKQSAQNILGGLGALFLSSNQVKYLQVQMNEDIFLTQEDINCFRGLALAIEKASLSPVQSEMSRVQKLFSVLFIQRLNPEPVLSSLDGETLNVEEIADQWLAQRKLYLHFISTNLLDALYQFIEVSEANASIDK